MKESSALSKKNFDNYAEIVDSEGTLKTLCKQCGGEGRHYIQWMDGNSLKIYKEEVVNCDQCEAGFRYGILDKRRSSSGRSRNPSDSSSQRR